MRLHFEFYVIIIHFFKKDKMKRLILKSFSALLISFEAFVVSACACTSGPEAILLFWVPCINYPAEIIPTPRFAIIGMFKDDCKEGKAYDCEIVAEYYEEKGSRKKAINYYEKSCELGNYSACEKLVELYSVGDADTKKDETKAQIYFDKLIEILQKQCDKSNQCVELGRYYYTGRYVEQNKTMAKEYFDKACEKEKLYCKAAGDIYFEANDFEQATIYFDKACKKDKSYCEKARNKYFEMGDIYFKAKDYKQAQIYYDRACDNGSGYCEKAGNKYFEIKDYKQAKIYYHKACERGKASVCFRLGESYFDKKDDKQAQIYYDKACKSDSDGENCLKAGDKYFEIKNYKQAKIYYHKACEKRHYVRDYCAEVGERYFKMKEYKQAQIYYDKACEKDEFFCQKAGNKYFEIKDYKQAKIYYEKGCKRGRESACVNLGELYLNGWGVEKDGEQARIYFDEASAPYCKEVGDKYFEIKDYKQAKIYYEKDTTIRNNYSSLRLGELYLNGLGVKKDDKQARIYFDKACSNHYNESEYCEKAGAIYLKAKDYKQAKIYYEKACDFGSIESCRILPKIYMENLGVKKDDKKVFAYYEKICKMHNGYCIDVGDKYLEAGDFEKSKIYYDKWCKGERRCESSIRERIIKIYEKPCEDNNLSACVAVGQAYSIMDKATTARGYRLVVDKDEYEKCAIRPKESRSLCYSSPDNYKDDIQAGIYFKKACDLSGEKGSAACKELKELLNSKRFYCNEGNAKACERLKELKELVK